MPKDEVDKSTLCNNDELDDAIPMTEESNELYRIFSKFGKNNETWYRCTLCKLVA